MVSFLTSFGFVFRLRFSFRSVTLNKVNVFFWRPLKKDVLDDDGKVEAVDR